MKRHLQLTINHSSPLKDPNPQIINPITLVMQELLLIITHCMYLYCSLFACEGTSIPSTDCTQ